ncbi:MAG: hypothetical protein CVU09_17560 [Bacteroidetes bacterium HGW-Bacteroidetes-4]|jgi:hypothetical protein|nr:MAG: hypothetical protein CVU09_17560 [Bacteroidetes bacterium HGW-Bacteroidetes-4]
MKKIVLSGLFALLVIYPACRIQSQTWELAPLEVRETLEKAAQKQAIGLEQEMSDSLTQLYLNLVHQLDSMQADTQVITHLVDTTSMMEVFEKYTKALAKEKRFVPNIRRLAFKQVGFKQSRSMVQEEGFELKLINEYPRVQFTRYLAYGEVQVYVDDKLKGPVSLMKKGLIMPSNRDSWVELRKAGELLCAQRVRLKRGEVFDFSCEP